MKHILHAIIRDSMAVKAQAFEDNASALQQAVEACIACLKQEGTLFFCGNGGSAADSQHMAAEFIGRFQKERRALAAIALTTDTSILTSLANDYSYDIVFSRQLEALGRAGDVVFGISTSGRSRNVVKAFEAARLKGMLTVAFTGGDGGPVAAMADIRIIVRSQTTARVQETHSTFLHALCEVVEKAFVQ